MVIVGMKIQIMSPIGRIINPAAIIFHKLEPVILYRDRILNVRLWPVANLL